ncbi:MAG: HigA family addiction module antitoxin [Roseovarius sp.]|nr:HigA family addiction module antitoxin [Roseovarius sp.]MCY4209414.1 HigA family addiction module antitoxin [Roseovarius sp.]MCY4292738.1 HigA family addiction module antitoxin [Roseovarius sp.]
MAAALNQFSPDYAVSPGRILEERLEEQGISHAEFARRCGRSPKMISEIISGKAPLLPETALQFEKVLGVNASIWLGIEVDYQLHNARKIEAEEAAEKTEWVKSFPVKELIKRSCFKKPESESDAVFKLLAFFGVGSVDAWGVKYGAANVAYRHSQKFNSCEKALATWLRLGELEAERQEFGHYREVKFKCAVREIRGLTSVPVDEALEKATRLCNHAGVALAVVQPLPKTALSGAAWWINPGRPIIQLSARHKSDDHLWFSFFHEAAHILLHGKKSVFVDGGKGDDSACEAEANAWAADLLVSKKAWANFTAEAPFSEQAVRDFASQQGIAPGIIVGMLQHGGYLPWSHLNKLKARYEWVN